RLGLPAPPAAAAVRDLGTPRRCFGPRNPCRAAADRRVPAHPAALVPRPLWLHGEGRDHRVVGSRPARRMARAVRLRPARPARSRRLLGPPVLHQRPALLLLALSG